MDENVFPCLNVTVLLHVISRSFNWFDNACSYLKMASTNKPNVSLKMIIILSKNGTFVPQFLLLQLYHTHLALIRFSLNCVLSRWFAKLNIQYLLFVQIMECAWCVQAKGMHTIFSHWLFCSLSSSVAWILFILTIHIYVSHFSLVDFTHFPNVWVKYGCIFVHD